MNDLPEFMTDGKEFFVVFNTPLVTGYMPVPIPKANPILHWHGPKIDLFNSWYPALKFMAEHAKHEVVLRIFMTKAKDQLLIFPLTQQYGTGMSVKEEITKEEREWWAVEGLIEAGTIHSHCDAAAFASGTDKHDEQTRDGLHLTVGKLRSNQFDLHARMTWTIPGEEQGGQMVRAALTTTQQAELNEWFTLPAHARSFIEQEPELEDSIINYLLTKPPLKEVAYPAIWKTKLIEQPLVVWPTATRSSGEYAQHELSMAQDIPGFEQFKKKEEEKPNPDLAASLLTGNDSVWEVWQEVMELINESVACRSCQVAVSDFSPEMRAILFHQCPPARGIWEEIQLCFLRNHITEEEFFSQFGK